MYNLQINNRFLHLDYDDENEENLEQKKTVVESTKKSENKKEPAKKPKNNAAAVPPNAAVDKSKDSHTKPLANSQPLQEKAAMGHIEDNKRNNQQQQRPNAFSNTNFPMGGGGGGGGGNNFNKGGPGGNAGQFAPNRPPRPPGGGAGFGDNRGAKREFERRSGSEKTGVRANEKRDGAGPHNWGNSIKDFPTETFAPPADAVDAEGEEKKEEKAGEGKDGAGEGGGGPAAEEQEQVPSISLDQYFHKLGEKSVKPAFQLRKAGEGEGSFSHSGKLGKKIQKCTLNEEMVKIVEEKGSGRVKNYVEVNFPSMANRGGGRGRGAGGGRGGGRGGQNNYGGGQGGSRGDYGGGASAQPIVLDDESSFPALAQ